MPATSPSQVSQRARKPLRENGREFFIACVGLSFGNMNEGGRCRNEDAISVVYLKVGDPWRIANLYCGRLCLGSIIKTVCELSGRKEAPRIRRLDATIQSRFDVARGDHCARQRTEHSLARLFYRRGVSQFLSRTTLLPIPANGWLAPGKRKKAFLRIRFILSLKRGMVISG
jgi:hypothetical protein